MSGEGKGLSLAGQRARLDGNRALPAAPLGDFAGGSLGPAITPGPRARSGPSASTSIECSMSLISDRQRARIRYKRPSGSHWEGSKRRCWVRSGCLPTKSACLARSPPSPSLHASPGPNEGVSCGVSRRQSRQPAELPRLACRHPSWRDDKEEEQERQSLGPPGRPADLPSLRPPLPPPAARPDAARAARARPSSHQHLLLPLASSWSALRALWPSLTPSRCPLARAARLGQPAGRTAERRRLAADRSGKAAQLVRPLEPHA